MQMVGIFFLLPVWVKRGVGLYSFGTPSYDKIGELMMKARDYHPEGITHAKNTFSGNLALF